MTIWHCICGQMAPKLLRLKSSRPEVFSKKGALRSFAKFTGKHLYQSLIFNKVAKHFFHTTSLVAASGDGLINWNCFVWLIFMLSQTHILGIYKEHFLA